MSEKLLLTVEEVPAVAGKVNVYIKGEEAKVQVDFGVTQEPRFFERCLRGRPATQAPWVMSRICGVCSVVHLTCSIEAVEKALGIEPAPEVRQLREVAKGIEVLQNNFVHVLMSLPDFTGCSNAMEFSKKYPGLFKRIIITNNSILEVSKRVCGRFVHMPGLGAATHGKPISRYELDAASKTLREVSTDLYGMAEALCEIWRPLVNGFRDPSPTYCVLNPREDHYPFFSNELLFSDGEIVKAEKYGEAIEERSVPYSNAHYTLYKGAPFYVGSRARLQAYAEILPQEARELEKTLAVDYSNPFDNVKSQYVEAACIAGILAEMLEDLAANVRGYLEPRMLKEPPVSSGEGVGLTTAPRGVLIHHYRVVDGKLEYANIITPTVMNAKHIETAGEALIRWAYREGINDESRIKFLISALVRSYDPCLPCAVH